VNIACVVSRKKTLGVYKIVKIHNFALLIGVSKIGIRNNIEPTSRPNLGVKIKLTICNFDLRFFPARCIRLSSTSKMFGSPVGGGVTLTLVTCLGTTKTFCGFLNESLLLVSVL